MKKNNSAVLVRGSFAKIPVEAGIIYQKGNYLLSGRLIFPENATVRSCITQLSVDKNVSKEIAACIPEWKLDSVSLTVTPQHFCTEILSSGLTFLFYKQDDNGLLVFDMDRKSMSDGSLFKTLAANLGISKLTVCGVYGEKRISFANLPKADKLPAIPANVFSGGSSLLFAEFNLSEAGFPALKLIGELFNLTQTKLMIGTTVGNDWSCMVDLPSFSGGVLESKNMFLSFTVGHSPSFGLSGEFNLKIGNKPLQFRTQSRFGQELYLSASQLENTYLDLDPFRLSKLALALCCGKNGFDIAVCGRVQLRKIDVFGAIAFGFDKGVGVANPKMFSLAVSDITLREVVESIAGVNINADWLDKFAIRGIEISGQESSYPARTFERKDLAAWGNLLRRSVEGKSQGSEEEFTCEVKNDGRVSILDKSYMRHYALFYKGGRLCPQVEAQFLFAKEELMLGDYHIACGAFLCATIQLLGIEITAFLNIIPEKSVTACLAIAPIQKGALLAITGTGKPLPPGAMASPPAIISSIINRSSQKNGAVCYFSASKENGIQFYLDARIAILQIIEFQTRVVFMKGLVSIYVRECFLGMFEYILSLECSYGDFSDARFNALLAVDTSKLKEKFTNVQRKIEEAKATVYRKHQDVNGKLEEARRRVNQLNDEIASFDRQIGDKVNEMRSAWFFTKIKLAFQILGLEIAKAAVWCAMGIAKGVLYVAQKAVDLAFGVAQGTLSMVNAILSGVMNLFYIERFVIGAAVGAKSGFLFNMNFVLFGTHHSISYEKGSVDKSALAELDGKMSDKVDQIPKDMFQAKEGPLALDEMDFDMDELVASIKAGNTSITSEREIIKEMELLYQTHINNEMSYGEKEELRASYMEDMQRIREYTDVVNVLNKTAADALSELKIEEEPQGVQSKSIDAEALQALRLEREALLVHTKKLKKNSELLNKTIEESINEMAASDVVPKSKGEFAERELDPDWFAFASGLEKKLVTEAKKSKGNRFLVPGYEPSIIEAVRECSPVVKKSKINVPEEYRTRLGEK